MQSAESPPWSTKIRTHSSFLAENLFREEEEEGKGHRKEGPADENGVPKDGRVHPIRTFDLVDVDLQLERGRRGRRHREGSPLCLLPVNRPRSSRNEGGTARRRRDDAEADGAGDEQRQRDEECSEPGHLFLLYVPYLVVKFPWQLG